MFGLKDFGHGRERVLSRAGLRPHFSTRRTCSTSAWPAAITVSPRIQRPLLQSRARINSDSVTDPLIDVCRSEPRRQCRSRCAEFRD